MTDGEDGQKGRALDLIERHGYLPITSYAGEYLSGAKGHKIDRTMSGEAILHVMQATCRGSRSRESGECDYSIISFSRGELITLVDQIAADDARVIEWRLPADTPEFGHDLDQAISDLNKASMILRVIASNEKMPLVERKRILNRLNAWVTDRKILINMRQRRAWAKVEADVAE